MMRWRGAMLDISRHYFDAAFIKKTLSALAIFDYNTMHLHLTDDQGWRLESKVFPLLHEVGSVRKHSQNNHGLLEPTFDGKERNIEVHIFEFDKEIYKEKLTINIVQKIRDEIKFTNINELQAQLKTDQSTCLQLLNHLS